MRHHYGVHRHTFRCYRKYFFRALLLCLSLIVLWGACGTGVYFLYKQFSAPALLSLIVLLPLIMMYRFFVAHQLKKMVKPVSRPLKPFHRLLLPAVYRLLTGLMWGIPFAGLAIQFYRFMFTLPLPETQKIFSKIGVFFSRPGTEEQIQLLIGTLVFLLLFIIALLVFILGWRRGICFDFAQSRQFSLIHSIRKAATIHRNAARTLFINTIIHVLLLIPVIAAPLIPIYLELRPVLASLTGMIFTDAYVIVAYVQAGAIPTTTYIISLSIFALLYLPWLPYRKLHNAAAMVNRHV